jgi:hypothetical protein
MQNIPIEVCQFFPTKFFQALRLVFNSRDSRSYVQEGWQATRGGIWVVRYADVNVVKSTVVVEEMRAVYGGGRIYFGLVASFLPSRTAQHKLVLAVACPCL